MHLYVCPCNISPKPVNTSVSKYIRQTMDINEKDPLEIFTDENRIILQKYQPCCVFCSNADRVVYFNNKRICEDCLEKIKTQL